MPLTNLKGHKTDFLKFEFRRNQKQSDYCRQMPEAKVVGYVEKYRLE